MEVQELVQVNLNSKKIKKLYLKKSYTVLLAKEGKSYSFHKENYTDHRVFYFLQENNHQQYFEWLSKFITKTILIILLAVNK